SAAAHVVGEHGALEQVAEHVEDALDRDFANALGIDETFDQLAPGLALDIADLEIDRLLSGGEFSPFLDEQLDEAGIALEELEIGAGRHGDARQRIGDVCDGGFEVLVEAAHAALDGG